MRIVIADTATGKSYQAELTKEQEANILGKKIGEELDGNLVGAAGYVLELKGGSDGSGFPMRKDVLGPTRRNILTTKGVGFNATEKGERRKRIVRGNTYSSEIAQVNSVVKKAGSTPLDQLFKKEEKAKESK